MNILLPPHRRSRHLLALLLAACLQGNPTTPPAAALLVNPASVALAPGATQAFTATVQGGPTPPVTWTCTGGTLVSTGVGSALYTAGSVSGTFQVLATSTVNPSLQGAAVVVISAPAPGVAP